MKMKDRVKLMGGVTISRLLARELRHRAEDFIPVSELEKGLSAEDELIKSIYLVPADLYDPKVKVSDLRSMRRKKTYAEDRREEVTNFIAKNRRHKEEKDRVQRGVLFAKPHDSKKDGWSSYFKSRDDTLLEIETSKSNGNKPKHTNEILDYFGFSEGKEKSTILGRHGDYHYGADLVRTAFHLASFFDLRGSYNGTPQHTKDIFLAIVQSIHQYGTRKTDLLIEHRGIENMPETVRDSHVLQSGGKRQKIPTLLDLETVVTPIGTFTLESLAPYFSGTSVYNRNGRVHIHNL